MGKYKKPGRVNVVSVLVTLVLVALAYSGWKFGPPYWRKWTVKRVVDEAAHWGYHKRGALTSTTDAVDGLRERTRRSVREAGVLDPSLRIHIKATMSSVTVSAEYHEIVQHLFVKKLTKLYFHPIVTVSK